MKIQTLSAILLSTLLLSSQADAADNKSIIKHRQGIMGAISGHFSASMSSLRGMEQFNDNQVFHAESIARLAKISKESFPAGSGDGKTKAREEIWENSEGFAKEMDDFIAKADLFASAVKSGDQASFGKTAKALGQSCKSCHDDFKAK
ncbi:MAG: cytochrome c [Spongiibacteraceae bacterium]